MNFNQAEYKIILLLHIQIVTQKTISINDSVF